MTSSLNSTNEIGGTAPVAAPSPEAANNGSGRGAVVICLGAPALSKPRLVPVTVRAALSHVAEHHRHLPKLQGGLFAVGVQDGAELVGVAIAGNPARVWQGTGRFVISRVAVREDNGQWADVSGGHSRPYCSMLLAAICRAGKALGYAEAWTYTLPEETGVSLIAAGFTSAGTTRGEEWDRPSRARAAAVRSDPKRRWFRKLTSQTLQDTGDDRPHVFASARPVVQSFHGAE